MKLLGEAAVVFDHILNFFYWVSCVLIGFMTVIVSADVFSRQVLGHPTVWVIELCEYGLLWITFLGTAWLLREEGHIRIDLIVNRLNPRSASMVDTITSVVGAVLCLIIAWHGAEVVGGFFVSGVRSIEMLQIPRYLILWVIPMGSFLLFIQFLRRAHKYWGKWRTTSKVGRRE